MTVTVNADLNLIEPVDLIVPEMAQQPLLAALQNLNFLYADHRPALASLMPMTERYVVEPKAYVFGVIPSADGIKYGFNHRFWVPVEFDMEIKVETNTGTNPASGWSAIYTADHTLAANVLTTVSHTGLVIAANITMLRVTYTQDDDEASFIPHHILVYPDADNPAANTGSDYPSGFAPFDDGLLASGQHAPIHTELIDRCKTSALALYRDRRQMVLSILSESSANTPGRSDSHDITQPYVWPMATLRCVMPGAPDATTIDLRCLASVSAGATAAVVRVEQIAESKAIATDLAGTGQLVSGTLVVYPQGSGLTRFVDLRVSLKATAGNYTYLHSLVGWPQLVGA